MSTPMHMTNCPSEETLAAFIDGRLDPEARQRVVEHVATCEDCYAIVSTAWDFQATEPATEAPGGSGSGAGSERRGVGGGRVVRGRFGGRVWWVGAAAAAVAAVVVGFVILRGPIRGRLFAGSTAANALVNAAELLDRRPIQSRVFFEVPYKKWQVMRGDAPSTSIEILAAAATIEKAAKEDPSSENLRALAAIQLFRHDPNQAIRILEGLLRANTGERDLHAAISKSRDGALLTDLSAAYLVRARKGRAVDSALAVEAATQALKTGSRAETVWNRALALEEMNLYGEAADAWRDYIALDPGSDWADEAAEHLNTLQHRPVSRWQRDEKTLHDYSASRFALGTVVRLYPRETMIYGQELLTEWAKETEREKATSILSHARTLGELLAATSTDRLMLDEAVAIQNAVRTGSETQLREGLGRLQSLRAATDPAVADSEFQAASAALERKAGPFQFSLLIAASIGAFQRNEFQAALIAARRVELALGKKRSAYPSLVVRAGWIEGMCLTETGLPHEAIAQYARSLDAATQMGDLDAAAALNALMAQTLSLVGRDEEGWNHRIQAFDLADRVANPQRLGYVVAEANLAAIDDGFRELPALLTRITTAEGRASKPIAAGTLMWEAWRLQNMGHISAALNEMRRARSMARDIEPIESRDKSNALIDLAEGSMLVEREPKRALDLLNAARRFFEKTNSHLDLAQLFERRARSQELLGNRAGAGDDIARALQEIESQRTRIPDVQTRATFIATRKRLFDRLMRSALDHNDAEAAFAMAERARARALLDEIELDYDPVNTERIQSALNPETALIEYYALDDAIIIWVVKRQTLAYHVVKIARQTLVSAADSMNATGKTNDVAGFKRSSAALREELLAPVSPLLADATLLVFVPDLEIANIPYDSLYDPASGKYLFQQFEAVVAPSASVYERLLRERRSTTSQLKVAVFGNSQVDSALFPELDRLDWVEPEVREIQQHFRNGDIFLNGDATANSMIAAADSYDVIHFAGHAILDVGDPDFAALILQTDHGESVPIYARQIRQWHTHRVSLVVLSACDTAHATLSGRESGRSLTAAFLAAHVPAVIGSLWQVNDAGAARFMGHFYEYISRGLSYAAALRQAKIDMLSIPSPREPLDSTWIAYQLTGTTNG